MGVLLPTADRCSPGNDAITQSPQPLRRDLLELQPAERAAVVLFWRAEERSAASDAVASIGSSRASLSLIPPGPWRPDTSVPYMPLIA